MSSSSCSHRSKLTLITRHEALKTSYSYRLYMELSVDTSSFFCISMDHWQRREAWPWRGGDTEPHVFKSAISECAAIIQGLGMRQQRLEDYAYRRTSMRQPYGDHEYVQITSFFRIPRRQRPGRSKCSNLHLIVDISFGADSNPT